MYFLETFVRVNRKIYIKTPIGLTRWFLFKTTVKTNVIGILIDLHYRYIKTGETETIVAFSILKENYSYDKLHSLKAY